MEYLQMKDCTTWVPIAGHWGGHCLAFRRSTSQWWAFSHFSCKSPCCPILFEGLQWRMAKVFYSRCKHKNAVQCSPSNRKSRGFAVPIYGFAHVNQCELCTVQSHFVQYFSFQSSPSIIERIMVFTFFKQQQGTGTVQKCRIIIP